MILKELTNNSIKYAGCRQIELKTGRKGKNKTILHDDGRIYEELTPAPMIRTRPPSTSATAFTTTRKPETLAAVNYFKNEPK